MKKYLFILSLAFLAACSKNETDFGFGIVEETDWGVPQIQTRSVPVSVTTRFNNPSYDPSTRKLTYDVEFSSSADAVIFGMNVRFHYDGSIFANGSATNVKFKNFAQGYGAVTPNPPYFGNTTAGISFFNLSTVSSTYVNGAMQKCDTNTIIIHPDIWTPLFQVELTVKPGITGTIYPSLIWDNKPLQNAGFVPGNAGVVIALLTENGTITCLESSEQTNWTPYGSLSKPYGIPNQTSPITIQ